MPKSKKRRGHRGPAKPGDRKDAGGDSRKRQRDPELEEQGAGVQRAGPDVNA